jgi:putative cofactor-binding repeat protein
VVIDGIHVTETSNGIFISDSHHVKVQNCASFGNRGVGIHISSADGPANDNTVSNCDVYNNNEEGIYMDVKVDNPVAVDGNIIENNRVYNNRYEGIQNTNQDGLLPRPNGTMIRWNQVEGNNGDWASLDLSGDRLIVEDNLVVNGARGGGIFYANGKSSSIARNQIHNSAATGEGIVIKGITLSKITDNQTFSNVGTSKTGVKNLGGCSENEIVRNTKTKVAL